MAKLRERQTIEFNTSRLNLPVTVLVPAWHQNNALLDCLASLENQAVVELRVIVCGIDPHSPSAANLRESHPRLQFEASPEDNGLGAALNRGLKTAGDDPYIAIVHPGVQIRYDCLVRLLKIMREKAAVGIALPRVMDADRPECFKRAGYGVTSAFEVFALPEIRSWRFDFTKPGFVPAAGGGCMLIRQELFRCAGNFDEDYFVFWEEIELSLRAYLKGYRCFYQPDAVIYEAQEMPLHPWSAEYVIHQCRGAWPTAVKHLSFVDLFFQIPRLGLARLKAAGRFAGGGRLYSALQGEVKALTLTRRMAQKRKTLPEPIDQFSLAGLLRQGDQIMDAIHQARRLERSSGARP